MAQLDKDKAEEAKNASSGFEPMPDGDYRFILKDVDATREGPKGPYWSWEFECIEPGTVEIVVEEKDDKGKVKKVTKEMKLQGRRQWNNTSLKSMWAFDQTFKAFGVPPDTDTDELIGKPCMLRLSITTIQAGARKGELTNQVDRVVAVAEGDEIVEAYLKRKAGEKEMADLF